MWAVLLGLVPLGFASPQWTAPRTSPHPHQLTPWTEFDRWPQETEEQRLLYFLAKHYQKFTRPVRNVSRPVPVKLGLTIIHIADMDEKNQVLTLNVWLDQQWTDEFMRWDPADFGGMKSMRIPEIFLWTPDIVLYNNADHYYGEKLASRAMVYWNGTVFWPIPARLKSTCRTDVTYFPFDSQHCYLKFGSWTYHGDLLNISFYRDSVDLSAYVKSGEFNLIDTHQLRRVVKYSCCENRFPDIIFFIHIQRKILFYVYNAVIPCSMLTCLTLLVFWLPPDSGEKITLGVTVLLAFSVFMLNIAERMPETSDSLPLIGCYLIMVMGLTSVSVLMTVIVLNFHHRGPMKSRVPGWVEFLILRKLRLFLGISADEAKKPRQPPVSTESPLYVGPGLGDESSGKCTCELPNTQVPRESPPPPTSDETEDEDNHMKRKKKVRLNLGASASQRRRRLEGETLRTLSWLRSSINVNRHTEDRVAEWRKVAEILDRLLFWIFLVVTVVISLVLLILIPAVTRSLDLHSPFAVSQYGISLPDRHGNLPDASE